MEYTEKIKELSLLIEKLGSDTQLDIIKIKLLTKEIDGYAKEIREKYYAIEFDVIEDILKDINSKILNILSICQKYEEKDNS